MSLIQYINLEDELVYETNNILADVYAGSIVEVNGKKYDVIDRFLKTKSQYYWWSGPFKFSGLQVTIYVDEREDTDSFSDK